MSRTGVALIISLAVGACATPRGVVRGTVSSSSGPVPDCVVELSPTGSEAKLAEARTDARGDFRFDRLPVGAYRVRARATEPLAPFKAEQRVIALPRGAIRGVELWVIRRDEGGPVSGVTVDQFDRPVGGLQVCGECPKGADHQDCCDTSSEQGLFALRWVRGPSSSVTASPDWVRPRIHEDVTEKVVPGQTDVKLVLRYLGRITGQVVNEAGSPVADFRVGDRAFEHGSFELSDKNKPTMLEIGARGFASEFVPVGEPDAHGDVMIPKTILTRGTEVHGRVIDAITGKPIEGAVIQLPGSVYRNRHTAWTGCGNCNDAVRERLLPLVRSGADGRFAFPHLSASQSRLAVTHDRYLDQALEVTRGKELVLKLERGAAVSGRAVDATGEGLARVVISIDGAHWRAAVTSDDGSFELSGLSPGPHRLDVDFPRAVPFRVRLEIQAGKETRVELREPTGATHLLILGDEKFRLVSGDVTLPAAPDALLALLTETQRCRPFGPPCSFGSVNIGRYTLLRLQVQGSTIQVDAQPLEVTGGRELVVKWAPVAARSYPLESPLRTLAEDDD